MKSEFVIDKGRKFVANFPFIDPSAIMGVVVSLIILAVGVFAFFVTFQEIESSLNEAESSTTDNTAVGNVIDTGEHVFNLVGVVLIIGAIMAVVGLVYNFIGGGSSPSSSRWDDDDDDDLTYSNLPSSYSSSTTKTKTVPSETKPTVTKSKSNTSINEVKDRVNKRKFLRKNEWM